MVKISVIIPVYNVENYIKEALNSILNQTMIDDIEVLMIDDGSTDESRYIIDNYALKYDNFHAFHKSNEGQGIARNYGLSLAKGEYVHFMDADDYLPPKAYETLYYFNPSNDFVVGNVLKFGEYNIWENVLFKMAFSNFNHNVSSFCLNDHPKILWDTITCNKLFKKEFLDKNNLRFIDRDTYYEDLLFSLKAYILADSIGFSRNIFYFWRLRDNKSSITQNQNDVRNFIDRINILKLYDKILKEYNLPSDLTDIVYNKWLNHDLKTSLKKFGNYPGKYYSELIRGAQEILKIIPDYLFDDLNYFLKVLYKMVDDGDMESLLVFAHLEDEFKRNPELNLNILSKYSDIDRRFHEDNPEFEVYVSDVFNDSEILYLEFDYFLSFISPDNPHEISVYLITENEDVPLEVHNNRIYLLLELIKNLNHLKIKVIYKSNSINRTVLLKNYNRKSIRYADFDIDLGIGINNILYLDVMKKTENFITVNDISLEDNQFIFECESISPVNNMILTNFVTYKQSSYPVLISEGSDKFLFSIPLEEFDNAVVKKWELNSKDSFNSIELSKVFKFQHTDSEFVFKNKRNKIFISINFKRNLNHELELALKENNALIKENKKLKMVNADLNNLVQEYKSRKAVKLINGIKKYF